MTLFSLDSLGFEKPAPDGLDSDDLELLEGIQRELRNLPLREREAISALAGVSNESCRDVARRYGKCPQTVCNWASNAKRKLKRKLRRFL